MIRNHPLILCLSPGYPLKGGIPIKHPHFLSKSRFLSILFRLILGQKCLKYDVYSGFYRRKWSEIIPWYYIHHYVTLERTIYPQNIRSFLENPIFNETVSTDIPLKKPNKWSFLSFFGQKLSKTIFLSHIYHQRNPETTMYPPQNAR